MSNCRTVPLNLTEQSSTHDTQSTTPSRLCYYIAARRAVALICLCFATPHLAASASLHRGMPRCAAPPRPPPPLPRLALHCAPRPPSKLCRCGSRPCRTAWGCRSHLPHLATQGCAPPSRAGSHHTSPATWCPRTSSRLAAQRCDEGVVATLQVIQHLA